MKKILGLDLGTTSIGWALVNEAESEQEKSSIIKMGVRVNPLSTDEQQNFVKGKGITTNADRTLKRGMRRNLQRYKLRRESLVEILKKESIITDSALLSENGNKTTFETYGLRAKAVTEKISLEELARVLLMINKKRGYKSNRKIDAGEEGQAINAMDIAQKLYDKNLTPGQFVLSCLRENKAIPDFYCSDLKAELDKLWRRQKEYYPELLTNELYEALEGKNKGQTWSVLREALGVSGIKQLGKPKENELERYVWRIEALSKKQDLEVFAVVIQEINQAIYNTNNYLGKISDRSKELYFNKQTVGQYLMSALQTDPHKSIKNRVFYRQDYLDEFERIWEKQAEYHKELTPVLKEEIRDVIIFYQRRLKSKKGLIALCEFERKDVEVEVDGKMKHKLIGQRVIPRSSPLFQEFKIWQILNNLEVSGKADDREDKKKADLFDNPTQFSNEPNTRRLYVEEMELLASELSIKEKMTKEAVLKLLFVNHKELDLNYPVIEGNKTQAALFRTYKELMKLSGHDVSLDKLSAKEAEEIIQQVFEGLGYNTDILSFDSTVNLDEQPMYKLWHLLYSFEGDDSKSGVEKLVEKLCGRYGFDEAAAKLFVRIPFLSDYGSLSARAIHKILPHMKEGNTYDVSCEYAGYKHSKSSLTKEQLDNKILLNRLELVPKNSLHNPVVEKILNQMVNVVNAIVEKYGKPDEIRVELARELKKSAADREEMTKAIARATREHEAISTILHHEFNLLHVSRNDVIRYKLYEELKPNGYKTLYSGTYIPREKLFSKEFDIEHIIPQSRQFDDSFSNKTLEKRAVNLEKADQTAYDYIEAKYGQEGLVAYKERVNALFKKEPTKKSKLAKLLTPAIEIAEGFISRDIRDTQYIAKEAKGMLEQLVRRVVSTSGKITARLREDWQMNELLRELNWNKYEQLDLTSIVEGKDGRRIYRIKDWSKRNDHRNHAVDALVIAFTKEAYIQYFNHMNARYDKSSSTYAIEQKYFERKQVLSPILPIGAFREEAKKQLESLLISIKAKNKVVTWNTNVTKRKGKLHKKRQQTPRGQLHNETIYGSQKRYVVKEVRIGSAFDEEIIAKVTKPAYREALYRRLRENGNDPKKAFAGKNALTKKPLFLNEKKTTQVPEKVKIRELEIIYTIRKEVSPELKIGKVVDAKIRKLLEDRLREYNDDAKAAFSNLDENPIWLNEEKNIDVKRVVITGVNIVEALHTKVDKDGQELLCKAGKRIPVDFVSTGSNHHVSIYRNQEGNLDEQIVSLYEAVARVKADLPIIDKVYKKDEGYSFLFSLKQNEYFVFPNKLSGFDPCEVNLLDSENYALISPNLYRVQKMTSRVYYFRHHLETTVEINNLLQELTWIRCGPSGLEGVVKVRINHLGEIVSVGEY